MEKIRAPLFVHSLRQRGFVMIEMILGVAVAMSLMVGGFWLWTVTQENERNRRMTSDMALLQVEMRSRFLQSATIPPGDYTQDLAVLTNIKNPGRDASRPLTAPTGGEIRVTAAGDGTFSIRLRDLPKSTCAQMVRVDGHGTAPFGTGVLWVESDPSGVSHAPTQHGPLGPLEMSVMCGGRLQDLEFRLAK